MWPLDRTRWSLSLRIGGRCSSSTPGITAATVTTLLMAFHVASDTEIFSTSFMLASEWLLSRVRIGMDLQRARPRKCLLTSRTYISIGRLRVCWLSTDGVLLVMVVRHRCHLWIDGRSGWLCWEYKGRRKVGRQGTLLRQSGVWWRCRDRVGIGRAWN